MRENFSNVCVVVSLFLFRVKIPDENRNAQPGLYFRVDISPRRQWMLSILPELIGQSCPPLVSFCLASKLRIVLTFFNDWKLFLVPEMTWKCISESINRVFFFFPHTAIPLIHLLSLDAFMPQWQSCAVTTDGIDCKTQNIDPLLL